MWHLTGVWTQALGIARLVFCHLSPASQGMGGVLWPGLRLLLGSTPQHSFHMVSLWFLQHTKCAFASGLLSWAHSSIPPITTHSHFLQDSEVTCPTCLVQKNTGHSIRTHMIFLSICHYPSSITFGHIFVCLSVFPASRQLSEGEKFRFSRSLLYPQSPCVEPVLGTSYDPINSYKMHTHSK
jgi:hypothetical protein